MKKSDNPDFDSLLPAAKLDRRGFVATALGAGFALAVQPVIAQSAIKTDSSGLAAGEIRVGELPAYRAQPEGGQNLPTILVVSEIFGVHEYIADVCRRLAKLGYLAIAPELFFRHGDPKKMTNVQEILSAIVAKVPDKEVLADLDACAAWAAKNGGDPGRLGITGFCWGGRITWLYAAHNPNVKAAVAWYGRIDGEVNERTPQWPLDIAGEIEGAVLGLYGGKDQGIPLDDVEAMKTALAKAGGRSQIVIYPEAGHAFHADYRPTYRKDAAEDGWQRLIAWFRQHGL
ncbi:dienelactone hydrolase family protein [Sulfuricystis multivorans]|uniref:dienelactone hydrolase family protein n=1 Tax=Sulfuricystis multivorans TaxID=2211108 RepID=UPI000F830664|nr:dienelactone hydrolase family protein [Sulfuricystis multivorans]